MRRRVPAIATLALAALASGEAFALSPDGPCETGTLDGTLSLHRGSARRPARAVSTERGRMVVGARQLIDASSQRPIAPAESASRIDGSLPCTSRAWAVAMGIALSAGLLVGARAQSKHRRRG